MEFIFRSLFLNNYLFQDVPFGDMYSKKFTFSLFLFALLKRIQKYAKKLMRSFFESCYKIQRNLLQVAPYLY
ncbi:hypothetical protein DXA69_01990 [Phocaeicola dorei]|nr:hypothetical protein DXA69_01990 [Phocaeicola dorei]RYT94124.1 hypothetical protein EAJ02_13500 [Phocaeicola dorei]